MKHFTRWFHTHRFHDVSIAHDALVVESYPLHWWPVKTILRVVHVVTRCHACMHAPIWGLEGKYLNARSKQTFRIPIDPKTRTRLAESYGIALDDDEDHPHRI